jgi:hypothetical protein
LGWFLGHAQERFGAGKNRLDEGTLTEKWHIVWGKCMAAVFWKTLFSLGRSKEIVRRDWDQQPCSETVIRGLCQRIAVTTASPGTVNRRDPWE